MNPKSNQPIQKITGETLKVWFPKSHVNEEAVDETLPTKPHGQPTFCVLDIFPKRQSRDRSFPKGREEGLV